MSTPTTTTTGDGGSVVPASAATTAVGAVLFAGPYTRESVHVVEPQVVLSAALMAELLGGVSKRLVITHRVFGDNNLLFRDENCRKIEDPAHLYAAKVVNFTNDAQPMKIEGNRLFDATVTMTASGAITNSLKFIYDSGKEYNFTSQASFVYWSGNTARLSVAKAKLS